NRNVHLLNHQVSADGRRFSTSVDLTLNPEFAQGLTGVVGFSIGLKGDFPGYQSACISGKGTQVGIDHMGRLVVGDEKSRPVADINVLGKGVRLIAEADGNRIKVSVQDTNGSELGTFNGSVGSSASWEGNVALLVDSSENVENEEDW